jgi:hypothetical protein
MSNYKQDHIVEPNKKVSSVDWLAKQMLHPEIYNPYIKKALEINKEQIINAYNQGYRDGEHDASNIPLSIGDISDYNNAENYYNETFKTD